MEVISRFIFNLLSKRQQVILPGIGTLYTEQEQASYDTDGGISFPHVRILFDKNEGEGENLLEIISRESGIALNKVKHQYEDWEANLKTNSKGGDLVIKGVLRLVHKSNSTYQVEVFDELDQLLNPMGTGKMELPKLPIIEAKKVEPTVEEQPQPVIKRKITPRAMPKKKKSGMVQLTIGILLVILLGGVYYKYVYTPTPKRSYTAPVEEPVKVEDAKVPEILQDTLPVEADSLNHIDIVVPVTNEPVSVSEPEVIPQEYTGDVYHVIGGVFSTQENADRFVSEWPFEGAQFTFIPTKNELIMVSVGKYTDKEQAEAEKNRLIQKYPDVWVSKRKK